MEEQLVNGKLYSIYDPGLNQWLEEYEYIGPNPGQDGTNLFCSTNYPFKDENRLINIFDEDLKTMVK